MQLVRQGFAREQRSFDRNDRKARGTHVDSFSRPPSLELGSSLSSALSTLNGREQRRSLSSCPLPLPWRLGHPLLLTRRSSSQRRVKLLPMWMLLTLLLMLTRVEAEEVAAAARATEKAAAARR